MKKTYREEFREKKRKSKKIKVYAYAFLSVIVFSILIYLLFFANWFDIRSVRISAPETISSEQIEKIADDVLNRSYLGIRRKKNPFIFSTDSISSEIRIKHPIVRDITINMEGFHELNISVTEREAVGVWCSNASKQCYEFDDRGIAFKEASSRDLSLIVIRDDRDRSLSLNTEVESERFRNDILQTGRLLISSGILIIDIEIPKDSVREFTAKTSEGWVIMFSTHANITKQVSVLIQFLKEKIKPQAISSLEYVDLRVDDRIYYK